MKKRIVAILLCMLLVLAALPGSVFADNESNALGITFSVADPAELTASDADQEVTVELKPSSSIDVNGISYIVNVPEGWSVTSIVGGSSFTIAKAQWVFPYNGNATQAKLQWIEEYMENITTDTLGTITIKVPGGTPAGEYDLGLTKILLSSKEVTKLETSATAPFKVKIVEPVLPKATVPTGKDLTYTGEVQTGVEAGEGYTLTGDVTGTDAGTYTATATLAEGYEWDDPEDPTGPKTIKWTIAPKAVAVPEGAALTYTGEDQTGVEEGEGYTLTGNVQKDAGEYTATAALVSSNYVWADQEGENATNPKTVAWSIAPKQIAKPEGKELTYTGEAQTGVEAGEGYKLEGEVEGTDARNYTATATLEPNYAWEGGSQDPATIDWSIAPADALGDKEVTAAVGDDVTDKILPEENLGEGTAVFIEVEENDGVLEFDEETGEIKAVKEGTAKIKVTYDGATNYKDGEYIVTITVTNSAPTGDMTARWIMVGAAALMIMVVYLFVSKKREEE